MKRIKLTQSFEAVVDDADFEWLNQWKWTYNNTGYAYRRQHLPSSRRTQRFNMISMHRLINETPEGKHTDHLNRNKLDNRRANLRTVTRSQNQINRGAQKNNTSGYKGISWIKRDKAWLVSLQLQGVCKFKKQFKDLEDAIQARQQAEKIYHV